MGARKPTFNHSTNFQTAKFAYFLVGSRTGLVASRTIELAVWRAVWRSASCFVNGGNPACNQVGNDFQTGYWTAVGYREYYKLDSHILLSIFLVLGRFSVVREVALRHIYDPPCIWAHGCTCFSRQWFCVQQRISYNVMSSQQVSAALKNVRNQRKQKECFCPDSNPRPPGYQSRYWEWLNSIFLSQGE